MAQTCLLTWCALHLVCTPLGACSLGVHPTRPHPYAALLPCPLQIAKCYGNGRDKLPLEGRRSFGEENLPHILACARAPLQPGEGQWWMEAEEPWQMLATCFEIAAAVESGDPASFCSRLPLQQVGALPACLMLPISTSGCAGIVYMLLFNRCVNPKKRRRACVCAPAHPFPEFARASSYQV